jgi:predicted dehydrogenase
VRALNGRAAVRPRIALGRRPRLGFAGAGWIGCHRLAAVARAGTAEVVAVADPAPSALEAARLHTPEARVHDDFAALLEEDLDAVVIATPSALHAEQSQRALERGLAVFCQKPVGRSAGEVGMVVRAARRADRLLAVDLCYRHTEAAQQLRQIIQSGALGRVHAARLVFHNAYGPDKPWFRDPRLAVGGCLMDLGIHLVDLVLWVCGFPAVRDLRCRLRAGGRPLAGAPVVEDYAVAQLELAGDVIVELACSWNLPAGRDAVIEASFFGEKGGAALRDVDGSFYDFVAERYDGTRRVVLSRPPDDWGGRAISAFIARLAAGEGYAADAEELLRVAEVLDRLYESARAEVPR